VATGHPDLIAYLRVSAEAQDTQLQRDALGEAGCVKFFEDKILGDQTAVERGGEQACKEIDGRDVTVRPAGSRRRGGPLVSAK
jgi:DNA invertase Pin-like site-specific DNA recombinase